MTKLKQYLPLGIALFFGWLTIIGLLFNLSIISDLVLGWAGFLSAAALLLGILNLIIVHFNRTFRQRNLYSGALILSMIFIYALAFTDARGMTIGGVQAAFTWVQAPLEAAVASLLAFFLLFAGFQMLKRNQTWGSALFIGSAILILVINTLLVTSLLPDSLTDVFQQIRRILEDVITVAGVRGLLLGVALGTILFGLRVLIGWERPYNK
jgi:hypothetical protein